MRTSMTVNGWSDGKTFMHIHQKWDLQTDSQLDCLMRGVQIAFEPVCVKRCGNGFTRSLPVILNFLLLSNAKNLTHYAQYYAQNYCNYYATVHVEIYQF